MQYKFWTTNLLGWYFSCTQTALSLSGPTVSLKTRNCTWILHHMISSLIGAVQYLTGTNPSRLGCNDDVPLSLLSGSKSQYFPVRLPLWYEETVCAIDEDSCQVLLANTEVLPTDCQSTISSDKFALFSSSSHPLPPPCARRSFSWRYASNYRRRSHPFGQ